MGLCKNRAARQMISIAIAQRTVWRDSKFKRWSLASL